MPLVACFPGWRAVLEHFLANEIIFIFPFKNDRQPKWDDDASMYTEADFSGYTGAQNPINWSIPGLTAMRALTQATTMIWQHNGGPNDNQIFGVCWVDGMNNLLFAERDPRAPITVSNLQRAYAYTPRLSDTAEFPG